MPPVTTVTYADWKALLKDERLPAAVVDLDAFDRNLARLAAIATARGKKVRIATKSIRVPALIDRVLKAGNPFVGLMCFSAEEALQLAIRGHDDLLLAYPTVQRSDLLALRETRDRGKEIALVVDEAAQLAPLAAAMRGLARPFSVVVEVDVSLRLLGGRAHLGVRRSPVRTADQLLALLGEIERHPELRFKGLMGYEAQIAGLPDRNPFKRALNPIAALVRRVSARRVARLRAGLVRKVEASGRKVELFNGGGTGSFNWAADEAALTELTAGSALLCSHLFNYYSNIQFEPACYFALQVVRSSDPGYVTCQGGGYVASGEPGWDRVPIPALPEGLRLVSTEAAGEVQTPLLAPMEIPLGAPVLFRHAKAGELAERFQEYLLVSGGKVVERARTYRGLGLCFY